jgi:hypothetical protein
MNYQLNSENVTRILDFECVPEDEPLDFPIEDCEVSIRKGYINEDGEVSGNTIYIVKENLEICIVANFSGPFPYVMYRENDTEFAQIDRSSPAYVIEFVNSIWIHLVEDIQEREDAWNGVGNELSFDTFKSQFGEHKVPKDLKMLFDFEKEYGSEYYSQGFSINYIDKTGLKTWCEKQEFLNSFIEFATANGSGSSYAYWLVEKDIENCPIVVFGDEGGVHVVANSTKDLIHLLTFDTEITVGFDGVYFYRDEDEYEKSEYKKEFVKWAKENFALKAIKKDEETEEIVARAKDKYQDKLNAFLTSFGIEL